MPPRLVFAIAARAPDALVTILTARWMLCTDEGMTVALHRAYRNGLSPLQQVTLGMVGMDTDLSTRTICCWRFTWRKTLSVGVARGPGWVAGTGSDRGALVASDLYIALRASTLDCSFQRLAAVTIRSGTSYEIDHARGRKPHPAESGARRRCTWREECHRDRSAVESLRALRVALAGGAAFIRRAPSNDSLSSATNPSHACSQPSHSDLQP